MRGEQLAQARIRENIARQTAQQNHLTTNDIADSYRLQIDALTRPRRTGTSPD
jgi:hypothetical protein